MHRKQVIRKLFGEYGIRIWGLSPKELLCKGANMQSFGKDAFFVVEWIMPVFILIILKRLVFIQETMGSPKRI